MLSRRYICFCSKLAYPDISNIKYQTLIFCLYYILNSFIIHFKFGLTLVMLLNYADSYDIL